LRDAPDQIGIDNPIFVPQEVAQGFDFAPSPLNLVRPPDGGRADVSPTTLGSATSQSQFSSKEDNCSGRTLLFKKNYIVPRHGRADEFT
jgi:hypothetical protein